MILSAAFFSREMPFRKWSLCVLGYFGVILAFSAALMILVDPCLHYRRESIVPAAFTQPYWQIAGVLKHYRYDAVIVGSSTAQNFRLSLFREKLGLDPVKATASACYPRTGCTFAGLAVKFNPEVKTIISDTGVFPVGRKILLWT